MKKFLALVLTLAMVLTLNVGMIAGAADDEHVDVAGQTTVTIDEVTYTVINDLSAVETAGTYILSGDVVVADDAVITFAAGTVLNGNGYTITVEGNDLSNPLFAAPFALEYGEPITVTNVKFGTAEAPICLQSEEAWVEGEAALDIGLFANDYTPELEEVEDEEGNISYVEVLPNVEEFDEKVNATFENVVFNVMIADDLLVNVGGFMGRAFGNYTFLNCTMACELEVGDMSTPDGTDLTSGYAGGYFGQVELTAMATFEGCSTAEGSVITNDYRTGGFIGGVAGGISMIGCVNNAVLNNITLVTGGLIGWVEGETLSAWTLEDCVNNGDITAYVGPKDSAGSKHGDNGRSAAGLVGYIYKDADNTAPQIVVTGCTNNGNIYGEDRLAGLMGDNRVSYGEYTPKIPVLDEAGNPVLDENNEPTYTNGDKLYYAKPAHYENCVNTGDVKCIVKDAISGAHVLGGMVSRTQGPTNFVYCINYGTVDAAGMRDGHLGGIVGNTSAGTWGKDVLDENGEVIGNIGELNFEECVNYGAIMNGRRLGGINGTAEVKSNYTDCVNFGAINNGYYIEGGHTDNYAGGITGFADNSLHTYENCYNAGTIDALVSGGGIIGYVRENKVSEILMDGCVNLGNVTATTTAAAGLIGECKATIGLTITNSVNAGFITAVDQGYAAQIVGDAQILTAANVLMYGATHEESLPGNFDGMVHFMCFVEPALVEGETVLAKVLGESTDDRIVAVDADTALAELEELVGEGYVYNIDGAIKFVLPQIKGAQVALVNEGETVSVRLTGIVDDMEYDKVGFVYAVATPENDEDIEPNAVVAAPMENIIATNMSGNEEVRDASILGGNIKTVVVEVPAEGEAAVVAYMKAYSGENVFYSRTVYVYIVDGEIAFAGAF